MLKETTANHSNDTARGCGDASLVAAKANPSSNGSGKSSQTLRAYSAAGSEYRGLGHRISVLPQDVILRYTIVTHLSRK